MQKTIDYQRIASAIEFIQTHFKDQPDLATVAEHVHLSPAHFQRLFSEWAGTSPKKFLQYLSIQYAKNLLTKKNATLFDAAMHTGLSGTSRLHDLFINIEGMTPAEYKHGGEQLKINYSYSESLFGRLLIASTYRGICYLGFETGINDVFKELSAHFPNAQLTEKNDPLHTQALLIFNNNPSDVSKIKMHLKGTDFQLKVWEALLKIPMGKLNTYGQIAEFINHPKASRAVGTAIGSNPIAYLIPCHRVIRATGVLGGYVWGTTRKSLIIGWEAAQIAKENGLI